MKIKVEIGTEAIHVSWNEPLDHCVQQYFDIDYGVDLSTTPKHVLNFMVGILLSEHFAWNQRAVIFDELTEAELACIKFHVKMNFARNLRDRSGPWSSVILVDRIVEQEVPEDDGPVLCANGMGKDGLSLIAMADRLDVDIRCFTFHGQYRTEELWNERITTSKQIYDLFDVPFNLPRTSYWALATYSLVPFWVMALPLAYHYRSPVILANLPIGRSAVEHDHLFSPNDSVFSLAQISKATRIEFSSWNLPLSIAGTCRLLWKLWPDLIPYQRTCHQGTPWCRRCRSCYRLSLYYTALGADTRLFGLPPFDSSMLTERVYEGTVYDSVMNCYKRLRGEPYDERVFQAAEPAFEFMWMGNEVGQVLKETLGTHNDDLGPNEIGFSYPLSKWREWIDTERFDWSVKER